MRVFLATVLLFCVSAVTLALPQRLNGTDGANIYALLVAGSNTWMNYRHQVIYMSTYHWFHYHLLCYCSLFVDISLQADVCHAYQILKKHGVPDENIVVMMYDDIAHSPEWVR